MAKIKDNIASTIMSYDGFLSSEVVQSYVNYYSFSTSRKTICRNKCQTNVHKMIKADTVGYNNSLDESQLDENILFPESDGSDNIPMKSMLTHRANKKSD